jgi:hypothetical protein
MKTLTKYLLYILLIFFFFPFGCRKSVTGSFVHYTFDQSDKEWFFFQPGQQFSFRNGPNRITFIVDKIFEDVFPGISSCEFCGYKYSLSRHHFFLKTLNDTSYLSVSFSKTIPEGADIYNPPVNEHGELMTEFSFFWKNPVSNFWYSNDFYFLKLNKQPIFQSTLVNGQLFTNVLKYEQSVYSGIGKIKTLYYDKYHGLLKFTTHDGNEWTVE